MSTEQQHLEQLLAKHQARLRVLEMKEAQFGINVPPEVVTEMEDIRQEIASINLQLNKLRTMIYGEPKSRELLEIIIWGIYRNGSKEAQDSILISMAAFLEIPLSDIKVRRVSD